jgi:hypothetical protein
LISRKSLQELILFFKGQKENSAKSPSILFLFGPSGSGKNSTINFFIKEHGFFPIFEKDLISKMDTNYNNFDEEEIKGENKFNVSHKFVLKTALLETFDQLKRFFLFLSYFAIRLFK